jgi:hypothetical protein
VEVDAALRLWARLAEVAPEDRSYRVAAREDLAWLGLEIAPDAILGGGTAAGAWGPGAIGLPDSLAERSDLRRLARLDALHDNEYLLRLGWVVLVGTVELDGRRVPVVQPLLARPVSIRRRSLLARVATASSYGTGDAHVLELHGEAEINRLVDDPARRGHLAATVQFGGGALAGVTRRADDRLLDRLDRLRGWARDATLAMGLPAGRMTLSPPDWATAFDHHGLRAHVGSFLYVTRNPRDASVSTSLRNWAGRRGLDTTALGAVLGAVAPVSPPDDAADTDHEVLLPMVLSASQEEVVRSARREAVTVLSGAPGTGKTHTLCAVAVDTIARGGSVLIATHSRAAADAVTDLLDRTAGPDPVRFGDGSGIARVIDELEQRRAAPLTVDRLEQLAHRHRSGEARRQAVLDSLTAALELEARAERSPDWDAALPALRNAAPGFFDPATDLAGVEALLATVTGMARTLPGRTPWGRWWARRRTRRSREALARLAGASEANDPDRLIAAAQAAADRRAQEDLALSGGTHLDSTWDALATADTQARAALGEWLEADLHDPTRLRDGGASAVSDLLTALKAGRGNRRDLLAALPSGALTASVPLWVGTLGDVEDVLPAEPRLFDVVILDEASHIEQSRAAGALLRGRRALVVGDPRQLRHTSFMSDQRLETALAEMGLSERRSVLDVRRVTAFDLAAAVGNPIQLREHFRSEPHLIGFSLARFYRDEVVIMTTSPATETTDCIDEVAVPVPGVEEVAALVERLVAEGVVDLGVITPFREYAEALEDLLGRSFDAEEIRRLRLRVGTVHGFQGAERDVMVVAPGLAPEDPPGRRRFVEDPHLFNVMVTRARHRCIVATSVDQDVGGLLGEYLRYGDRGPQLAADRPPEDGWTAALSDGLSAAGLTVRTGYRVGRWTIDLLVGSGTSVVALETRIHPDGVGEHVRRHLGLAHLGWRVRDAYPSRWDGDTATAIVELSDELGHQTRAE